MAHNTYTYEEAFEKSLEYFNNDELAAKVFIDKYALKDKDLNLVEKSPEQMFDRVATELARIEKNKFKQPLSKEQILDLISGFKRIIPQGGPLSGIGNPYQYVSISNCFVVPAPLDSYAAILRADENIVQISKRRGGVGLDLSHLRPKGTPTSNAAKTSTGIIPFAERFSNTIREVGQEGRRGALMLSLSVHHPEVLAFASVKKNKDKVTGANLSIRLTDEFLKAVENDTEYEQRWPVDSKTPTVSKMVNAKEVWMYISQMARDMAEPGLLFWDNILRESPADCYPGFQTSSTNPCVIGETLVTTDKGNISIQELIKNGIENYKVATLNIATNEIEFETIVGGQQTRKDADIIEIELDDGEKIQLTPDHQVFTKNRGYVKAALLDEEDIILKIENATRI